MAKHAFCPHCGRPLEYVEELDSWYDTGVYTTESVGQCLYCDKLFTYKERYELAYISEIEELNKEG